MTPAEARERFRSVVARGLARADREESEHMARLRDPARESEARSSAAAGGPLGQEARAPVRAPAGGAGARLGAGVTALARTAAAAAIAACAVAILSLPSAAQRSRDPQRPAPLPRAGNFTLSAENAQVATSMPSGYLAAGTSSPCA